MLKEENEASSVVLQNLRVAAQDNRGKRQAILEMEAATAALQELKHQCDEARKKAYRSNQSIEDLTTSLTNFRCKVEGKTIAPPTNDNLPDYIRELENKLGAQMRQVRAREGNGRVRAAGAPYAAGDDLQCSRGLTLPPSVPFRSGPHGPHLTGPGDAQP